MFMFCEYKMYPLYMYKEMPTVSLTDWFIGYHVCKNVGSCTVTSNQKKNIHVIKLARMPHNQ
jgi:hypothetical protein